MSPASTDEVLARLESLWRYLEDEGLYTRANTVSLAIDEIKRRTAVAWRYRHMSVKAWQLTDNPEVLIGLDRRVYRVEPLTA